MVSTEKNFITIVSGLPRSGTSMMMQMLAAGGIEVLTDNVRQPDEDNPRGYYEFEAVKEDGRPEWVDAADGKAVKMVYRLLYGLPADHQYRVIFMRRDLQEVIASQEVMLERHGKGSEVDNARLADLYRRQIQDVLSWLERQPTFSVLEVEYHDVLNHPDQVADRLNRFLGGNLDVPTMQAVPDAGLYRQRRASVSS